MSWLCNLLFFQVIVQVTDSAVEAVEFILRSEPSGTETSLEPGQTLKHLQNLEHIQNLGQPPVDTSRYTHVSNIILAPTFPGLEPVTKVNPVDVLNPDLTNVDGCSLGLTHVIDQAHTSILTEAPGVQTSEMSLINRAEETLHTVVVFPAGENYPTNPLVPLQNKPNLQYIMLDQNDKLVQADHFLQPCHQDGSILVEQTNLHGKETVAADGSLVGLPRDFDTIIYYGEDEEESDESDGSSTEDDLSSDQFLVVEPVDGTEIDSNDPRHNLEINSVKDLSNQSVIKAATKVGQTLAVNIRETQDPSKPSLPAFQQLKISPNPHREERNMICRPSVIKPTPTKPKPPPSYTNRKGIFLINSY